MKLGEVLDSIYAYSFPVQEGYSTPAWPYDKAVKILEAIDGTIIDVVNFGAREHRSAEFNLNYMPRATHYALKTYLEANLGLKIRVTIEDAGERVFGEQYVAGVYYAYLTEAKSLGETQFSAGHALYGYSLKMELAGTTSGAIPNAADTSQYDFLHVMDCVRVTSGCQVANKTALDTITTKPGGSRGLTLDNLKVYFFNAASSLWEYQYTVPANDPSKGLKNGVFRWSAFSDVSGSSTGMGGDDFKSGWIVERSIKFPRYSVDARQGPAVEHPEGYSFAAPNDGKLWKFPLDNNLAFYGAFCQLYVYDRLNGQLVLIRSGYNNRNAFDYTVLEFEVEPGVFLQNKSFPTEVVGPTNFPNADQDVSGKPLLSTYGRWEKGELQTIAFNMDPIRFPIGKRYLGIISYNSTTKQMVLDLDVTQFQPILGYDPTGGVYPSDLTKLLYVAIYSQADQVDVKKLKKITAVDSATGKAQITLQDGFKSVVDTTAIVVVYLSNIQILADNKAVVGLGKPNYLKKGVDGQTLDLELYGKDGDTLTNIPAKTFKVVENGKENQITVDSNYISLESGGEMIVEDAVPLSAGRPAYLHAILDKTHVNGYSYFDFGFSPKGSESNEITIRPLAQVTKWGESKANLSSNVVKNTILVKQGGEGKLAAAFSKDFTTLIWNCFAGASGYRLCRYIAGYSDKGLGYGLVLDPTFGQAGWVEMADGSTYGGVNGVVTIAGGVAGVSDGTAFIAIDHSVSNTQQFDYVYTLEPIVGGVVQSFISSNTGKNRSVPDGMRNLVGVGKAGAAVLAWAVPDSQASFTITKDGTDLGGMPVTSAIKGWYEVTGLTNGTDYKFKASINCLSIGTAGDVWFVNSGYASDHGIHQLLKAGDPYADLPYDTLRDSKNCDLEDNTDQGYVRSWGVVTRKKDNVAVDFPAAGVVFSWTWKINKEDSRLQDLSGAKDVRVLGDFVVRSWVDASTPVPFIIQLRGLKADKSVAFTIQYKNMLAKTPTDPGAYGAFAQFLNLHGGLSGSGSDSNYETDSSAPSASGIYTGKDLWKLPDYLFEDGAQEWSQVEYLVFSITNASSIVYSSMIRSLTGSGKDGYHMGIGGPPKIAWSLVAPHKPDLYIEYVRKFDGGLRDPIFARIDGGRVDDGSGTFTGTPGAIIEKARHVIDHVVYSMIGTKPVCVGTEMQSRDGWIWHWQTKDSKPLLDTLLTLATNIWGFFTLSPDDKLYLRSLDIEDPNNQTVFAFTDSNIIRDSLGKPEMRRRSEIYQKFLLKYNVEPSEGGKSTEEMLIGWDLASSQPIGSGYSLAVEDANGIIQPTGSLDGLPALCRLSIQLNAAGVGLNEYGTDPNDEKIFEMFYRPTKPSSLTGAKVERPLPNLESLWGVGVKAPKAAMQDLTKMLVKFFTFDSWYLPLSCSMKNLIYNSGITGKKDEAGTPDNRLKLGDVVTITSAFHTNNQPVRGFIFDIELSSLYDGYATLHVFVPRPPGQFGPFVDPIWDAGAPGPRNPSDYLFKGSLYGLLSEDGTFADAGAPGSRNPNNFEFPDGTFADPKGTGSGKA